MSPRAALRALSAVFDAGRWVRRPWLRVALGVVLAIGAYSAVLPPRVLGEGSADLEANGGKRALTEWRTSLYGNLLPRRTLFKVYAKVGEEIALGSSGVGVGSGDIVVWNPGQITAPLTVVLPAPAFTCSVAQPGLGALTTRAQESAGPTPAAGGYTPCIYTAATTGVYDVAFYGPLGGQSDGDGTAGTIAAPVIDTSQNSGVSMWDITVRAIAAPDTPIGGRVFTDYLAQITGGNGATNRVESTLWAVTSDGFQYRIDLRGLDPNGFILYGNTVGFLDPDGLTPLYHDLVADINPLTSIEGGVSLSGPTGLLFFAPPAADLPPSIVPTPVVPTVNSITFQGTAGVVGGLPGSVLGSGGNIAFDSNIGGVAHVVIVPNPGGSGCVGAVFDPALPTNRSLVRVVAAGVQNIAWDGKDNSGADMPVSWTGSGGLGYCFGATLHAGEYHFPLLDAENSVLGGPTITLLNPPGGTCPFGSCSTAFFDDRGYRTSSGATVGTVGSVLTGNNPPPPPYVSDTGYDTASTTIRAYGDNSAAGFGNQKGLDLWTYFPSADVVGQLVVVPQGTSDLSITKTHVGDFTVGANGVYTLSVQNVGSGSLAGLITVSDDVPAGLTVVSAAGTGWTCGVSGQVVTCTVTPTGGLSPGASLPAISLTVDPTPAAAPSVTNIATVANANDLNTANDSSSSPTGIVLRADLSITKTDGTTTLDAGATTTYTLVVTNAGPSPVSGAILADPAVAGLAKTGVTCAAAPGQCTAGTTPTIAELEGGAFALPALAAGQTYALAVTADVTAPSGSVANSATIAVPAGVTDPTPANDSATDTDTVGSAPTLALAKTADPLTYDAAGDIIAYAYEVTNSGNVTLSGPFTIDDDRATDEACPATASLDPGDSINCTATYTIAQADMDAGSVTNTASATNGTVTSNTDSVTVTAVPAPGLTLVKTASRQTFTTAGTVIGYEYAVTNEGNVSLAGPVTVADDKTTVTCPDLTTVGDLDANLDPGESVTCTASYTVTPADVAAKGVTNVATASVDGLISEVESATVTGPGPIVTSPPTNTRPGATAGSTGSGPASGAAWLGLFALAVLGGTLALARRRRGVSVTRL